MREARDQLQQSGLKTDYLRLRATPLPLEELERFFADHDRVYVVEQNRDGQMEILIRAALKGRGQVDKLRGVRHYTGYPIDARTISDGILNQERAK
jgi:2-oxoglutarate ferredoxin oxidoreductase subunit alpha